MTLLIRDTRRPLLGGLIDDGSMLAPDRPDPAAAADRFRTARGSPEGWMIDSFVVTAPAVEDLAGIPIRTMRPGETPWKVTVAFGSGTDGVTSTAAAFHPVSATDDATGITRFGALNLLAVATGAAGRSVDDAAALLVDDGSFTVGFGGLDSPAGRTLSMSMGTPTRGPLLAIITPEPDAALRSLAAHASLE